MTNQVGPPSGCAVDNDGHRTVGQRWGHFEQSAGLKRLAAISAATEAMLASLSAVVDSPGVCRATTTWITTLQRGSLWHGSEDDRPCARRYACVPA